MVLARQRAGEIAGLMGFAPHDQTRVSTAVSEAVRDCVHQGGLDEVAFLARDTNQGTLLEIHIAAPRIEPSRLDSMLEKAGALEDPLLSGMAAAKRLMDEFVVEASAGGGSTIILGRYLPQGVRCSAADTKKIADQIAKREPRDTVEEMRQQNQELVVILEEVRKRQEELIELNRELEDTNRGVLALHVELEQRSEQLRRANELKTRFISEMSHEFRTPINSILSLCQILLARVDGDLTSEQEKQIGYIKKSADDLSNLVNDLLDLAKIEAGKIEVHPSEVDIGDLFGALKGAMRPLMTTEAVRLIFEEPSGLPTLFTDEAKVAQILRNLLSNAIKFTEHGEIRVSAAMDSYREMIVFSVADTGIGISRADQEMIFQEFIQLRSPIQKKVKGTGLGLPLSRKLAELLGGTLTCKSREGEGSTFLAAIPIRYEEGAARKQMPPGQEERKDERGALLVIEDDPDQVMIYRKFLQDTGFRVVGAATLSEARDFLSRERPAAIILDILFRGEPDGWDFLSELKGAEATKDIPVLVVTILEDRQKGMVLGACDFCVKPIERADLLSKLNKLPGAKKLLIIDDEEVSRYILRGLLAGTSYVVIEARSGEEGLAKAVGEKPDVITLDLVMPEMSGFEVLTRLKADPRTAHIPVIIVTSKILDEEQRRELAKSAAGVMSKHAGSREQTIRQLRKELEKIAER
ncbi:MAG: response regulator [Desulfomonile sp.]|nr:response regulator [Desulfomonile sp.]